MLLLKQLLRQVKAVVQTHNDRGRLLWIATAWHTIYNFRTWTSPLRYDLLKQLVTRQCRVMDSDPNIPNGVFQVLICGDGADRQVWKVRRNDTLFGKNLARELKDPSTFSQYSGRLKTISTDPIVGKHFASVSAIAADGGYCSPFVDGYNLAVLRHEYCLNLGLPAGVSRAELTGAIERLLGSLREYRRHNDRLIGDWTLHNLVFDRLSRTIINVDVEGAFMYGGGAHLGPGSGLEATIEYAERELIPLIRLLSIGSQRNGVDSGVLEALSVVRYATEANVTYNGRHCVSGYHSMKLKGREFVGRRDCHARLQQIEYEFRGKGVLDIGCNCGGMLNALADEISWGVGIDADARCINAANAVGQLNGTDRTRFFTFDLQKEDLHMISGYLLGRRPDICFLLSICMWIENWREIIGYAARMAPTLLFESNGSAVEQQQQAVVLNQQFPLVELVASRSDDDLFQCNRMLYLCRRERDEAAKPQSGQPSELCK